MIRLVTAAVFTLFTALPLAAQQVMSCENHFAASVHAVAEPLEDHTATYANGAIRLVMMDLDAPACCSKYLVVLHPAGNEPPDDYRTCSLVAINETLGFNQIGFSARAANYDPVSGLTIRFPTVVTLGENTLPFTLNVNINQATGKVTLN